MYWHGSVQVRHSYVVVPRALPPFLNWGPFSGRESQVVIETSTPSPTWLVPSFSQQHKNWPCTTALHASVQLLGFMRPLVGDLSLDHQSEPGNTPSTSLLHPCGCYPAPVP
jgi:hypothetical protein